MIWRKFENDSLTELSDEDRDALLKVINNPSAVHTYKENVTINTNNQTYKANEVVLITQTIDALI